MTLFATSCQSENADRGFSQIIRWLSDESGVPLNVVSDLAWEDRRKRVDRGEIDVTWMCGLWYVKRLDALGQAILPLVAPVMLAARYGNRPVYYSDVLVRQASKFDSLGSLKSRTVAINEPDSHSGCVVLGHTLAEAGLDWGYFDQVVQSGSHLNSIELLLNGEVDAASIDTTTYDTELAFRPELAQQMRPVQTLGPSPIPPWTVPASLAPQIRCRLAAALTTMHDSDAGRHILNRYGYARFEAVSDADYDPIRRMHSTAERAGPIGLTRRDLNISADPIV